MSCEESLEVPSMRRALGLFGKFFQFGKMLIGDAFLEERRNFRGNVQDFWAM